MVSITRLNRPCPCGSGKLYKDCCAPGNQKARRRRKKPQKSESTALWRRRFADFALRDLEAQHALREYEQAAEAFQELYSPIFEEIIDLNEISKEGGFEPDLAFNALKDLEISVTDLEIAPQKGLSPEASDILIIYALARGLYSSDFKNEVVRRLRNRPDSQDIDSHFEVLGRPDFGLWRVEEHADSGLNVTRVDGQSPPHKFTALDIVDARHNDVSPGTYLGVRVQLGNYFIIFLCTTLEPQALEKFERAAERQAWGNAASFRLADYEKDLLSLLASPTCIDTERADMRVFLDATLPDMRRYLISSYWDDLLDLIPYDGLEELPDKGSGLSWDWFAEEKYAAEASLWTVTAARAHGEGFKRLVEVLHAYRVKVFRLSVDYSLASGPASYEYVAPMRTILAAIGLQPDGSAAHPSGHDALDYPVGVLDFDAKDATLKSLRIGPKSSLFDAMERVEEAGAKGSKDHEAFQAAVRAHLEAYRWTAIASERTEEVRPEGVDLSYDEFIQGLHAVMPARVKNIPLTDLEDPGRGTWKRLHTALCGAGIVSKAPPLLVGDIPGQYAVVTTTPGFGATSLQNLVHALIKFVNQWPESEGFEPVKRHVEISGEAADKFSSGLDDLDDLF